MHAQLESRHVLDASELAALWQLLSQEPDTPDYFELSEYGEIILSPSPTNRHQSVVAWAQAQLRDQLGDRVVPDLAVTTIAGVRKPDVAWLPEARWAEALSDKPLASCPAVVVEVLSPRNQKSEIAHRIEAYLASGAMEVVVIDMRGAVSYHRADGEHLKSAVGLSLSPPKEMFA